MRLPTLCPICCAEPIAAGLAAPGTICQGCAFEVSATELCLSDIWNGAEKEAAWGSPACSQTTRKESA